MVNESGEPHKQSDDVSDDDVLYAHSYQQPDGKYTCELRKLDGTPVIGCGNYDSEMEAEIAAMRWYMHYMATGEW